MALISRIIFPAWKEERKLAIPPRTVLRMTLGVCVAVLAACEKKPQSALPAAPNTPPQVVLPAGPAFAPAGVFFLVRKASLETRDGIFSYPPGTKVNLVGRHYVTPDARLLQLKPADVTNDLHLAQQFASQNAATRAAFQRQVAQAAAAARLAPPAATPAPVAVAVPAPTAVPTNATPRPALGASSRLNEKSYDQKQAFTDTDGDGRKFDFNQKSRK